MRRSRVRVRPGYTLLEVLIASAIGVLLLAALYFAFDLTLRSSDAGRTLVAESDLNRAVINRMTLDLSSPLGVLPPMSGGTVGGSNSETEGTETTAPATTTPSSTTTTTDGAVSTAGDPLLAFQAGAIGTSEQLILFVSKLPQWLSDREADPNAAIPSDVRRISYYLHSSGKGLCRQDRQWITADRVGNSTELDRETEDADIIAPEVVALEFGYASGTDYISEWDGTQAALDGTSTTGPPRAIKVTLTFEFKDRDGATAQKKIVHIFPIRAAVGLIPPDATTGTGM